MSRKKKKKKKKRVLIFLSIIGAILLFVVLLFAFLYLSGRSRFTSSSGTVAPVITTDEGWEQMGEALGVKAVDWKENWVTFDNQIYEYDPDTINLLIMGIDKKGKLAGEKADYKDYKAGQADAIFILSLNPNKKTMKILGIPRNSMIPLKVYDEDGNVVEEFTNQICLQYPYAGGGQHGLDEMSRAVSEMLYQLPIHGKFAIGYDAIGMVNDTLGGVTLTVLEDVVDYPELKKGKTVHLMGKNAIAYVQRRDVTVLGSPTTRLMRQKQYLLELMNVAKPKIKENPFIITQLYNSVAPYMITDVTLDEIVYLGTQAVGYTFNAEDIRMIEGRDNRVDYINEKGQEDFYDDLYLDEDSLKQSMIDIFYTPVSLE